VLPGSPMTPIFPDDAEAMMNMNLEFGGLMARLCQEVAAEWYMDAGLVDGRVQIKEIPARVL
jgi:hypothetical protein